MLLLILLYMEERLTTIVSRFLVVAATSAFDDTMEIGFNRDLYSAFSLGINHHTKVIFPTTMRAKVSTYHCMSSSMRISSPLLIKQLLQLLIQCLAHIFIFFRLMLAVHQTKKLLSCNNNLQYKMNKNMYIMTGLFKLPLHHLNLQLHQVHHHPLLHQVMQC